MLTSRSAATAFAVMCTMLFCVARAEATTYYVSKSGSDANSCATAQSLTQSSQKLTIAAGIACLTGATDTLMIHTGTYAENFNSSAFPVSGASWTNYITVRCYPGESCGMSSSAAGIIDMNAGGANKHFIRFQGGDSTHYFTFDGASQSTSVADYGLGLTDNIDLTDVEVKNTYSNGIITGGVQHEWRNLYIHDNGRIPYAVYPQGANGIYFGGSGLHIIGGRFIGNKCYGVRFGDSGSLQSGNVIDGAIIKENGFGIGLSGTSDCGSGGGGLVFANTDMVAKNVILNHNFVGIEFVTLSGRTSTNLAIYNSTVYNNIRAGVWVNNGNGALTGTLIKNNIICCNSNALIDTGSGTVTSNNLLTDPSFVNASADDFRLQPGSPAIDAGVQVSGVSSDFLGVPRPTGLGYDIGAYEQTGANEPESLSAPKNVRIIR